MDDLTREERELLAAIGAAGARLAALETFFTDAPAQLDRLFDRGYVWVGDPERGTPCFLTIRGQSALQH